MTDARVATDALTMALLSLASKGLRPHCSQPETHHYYWTSEHEGERAQAALWCDHCPVLNACRKTAEHRGGVWGVWCGKDFSRRPGRKKAA
jgi:hypothetical protein